MQAVTIIPASVDHAAAAAEITREAFAGVAIENAIEDAIGNVPGVDWRDVKADDVRREFQDHPHDCFVAMCEGRVVGYATNTIRAEVSRGQIANLAVAKEFRGLGLGRRLILHSLDYFRSLGLTQAKIETLACNEVGRKLYPSLGFTEVARQIHYVMAL